MTAIERINFQNRLKKECAFEIVDLQVFMSTRPHHHLNRDFRINFWTLMYVTKGEGTHFIDFEPYPYKAGDIIINQKNQVNRFLVNSDVEGYIILIDEPFFFEGQGLTAKSFLEFLERPYKSPIFSVDYSMTCTNRILIDLIYKEYIKSYDSLNEDLIRGLFQSFIYSLDEYSKESKTSMETAVFKSYNQFSQLVESNYTSIKSVEEYSKLMLVSKKTINSATRAVVGLSAKQVITNRIILEIKRYLSQGDLMNYEIADLLGFDEPTNLTNFFKRYEKMSPTAFKESLK